MLTHSHRQSWAMSPGRNIAEKENNQPPLVFSVDSHQSSQDEFWIISGRSKRWYRPGSGHLGQVLASLLTPLSTHRLVSAVSPRISAVHQNIFSEWTLCCFPSLTWLQLGSDPGQGPLCSPLTRHGLLVLTADSVFILGHSVKCHRSRSVHNPSAREIWTPSCGSQQVQALTERDQHILAEPGPAPGPHTRLLLAARGHVTRVPAFHWLRAAQHLGTGSWMMCPRVVTTGPGGDQGTRALTSHRFLPRLWLVSVSQSWPPIGQSSDGLWYNSWS